MSLLGTAGAASAQVFLATRPHPEFSIGPLIVSVGVPRDLGVTQVTVSWSLNVPTGRTAPPEDLFLLWPRDVAAATAPGAADPELARYVEARGLLVTGSGRLALRVRDRARIGTGNVGDPHRGGRVVRDVHPRGLPADRRGHLHQDPVDPEDGRPALDHHARAAAQRHDRT